MKNFFEYFLPIGAGFFIAFFALPTYGGDLETLLIKSAIDWGIPVIVIRVALAIVLALILTFLFDILSKVAIWLAIVLILAALFTPAMLQDLDVVTDDVKNYVTEKMEELHIGS